MSPMKRGLQRPGHTHHPRHPAAPYPAHHAPAALRALAAEPRELHRNLLWTVLMWRKWDWEFSKWMLNELLMGS